MKLLLKRVHKLNKCTIGKLYVDDKYICDTLEDKDRGLTDYMDEILIKSKKVKGDTCIPSGTYQVTLKVQSPKYSRMKSWYSYNKGFMPRLLQVKGFDGILIHSGNTDRDTQGCILVGQYNGRDRVINSIETFKVLYSILKEHKDPISITIE